MLTNEDLLNAAVVDDDIVSANTTKKRRGFISPEYDEAFENETNENYDAAIVIYNQLSIPSDLNNLDVSILVLIY